MSRPSRPRQRQRVYPKCTWLTTPKSTWPRYTKPGEGLQSCEGCALLMLGAAGARACWAGPLLCDGAPRCGAEGRPTPTPTAFSLDHVLMQLRPTLSFFPVVTMP